MVLGDQALTEQFLKLGELAKGRVIRQATNFAMTPVLKEARARVPVSDAPHRSSYRLDGKRASGNLKGTGRILLPGHLKRSLLKRTSQSKNRYTTRTKVGAAGKDAWYGLLLERGFKSYAPNPFLQESLGAKANEATKLYKDKMRQAINRAVKRKILTRARISRQMWNS